MSRGYALIDCNNFYASCETLFRPDLRGKPVIVLSNNDGCVVARSPEAKALGIGMAVPFFKIRELVRQQGVTVFSSNYALYADISSRVMGTLERLAPAVEIYSIDEAFVNISGIDACLSLPVFAQQLRSTLQQHTGISVSVGMAPTRTLAKLANLAAKRYPATGGIVDLSDPQRQRRLLALTPVGDVWGIGKRLSARLQALGIESAADLACANSRLLRNRLSISVERTQRELNGEPCLKLDDVRSNRQQLICSRSFGTRITEFQQMREAVSEYTCRAAEKLRQQQQCAAHLTLFIRTSAFSNMDQYCNRSVSQPLPFPSNDSRELLEVSLSLLKRIWQDGYAYAKAGVMLSDFHAPGSWQQDLFTPQQPRRNGHALMKVMDQINQHSGTRLFFAAQGVERRWQMQRNLTSPAYTTRWEDLPRVR